VRLSCVSWGLALVAALLPVSAWAAGTPHTVVRSVSYDDGTVPSAAGEVSFQAWITTRPGEVLSEWSPGCGSYYDQPNNQWLILVECAAFPTPWSAGNLLHVPAWGDGSSHGGAPGEGCHWTVLASGATTQGRADIVLRPPFDWAISADAAAGSLTVQWSPPTGAEAIFVYRGTIAGFYPDVIGYTNRIAVLAGNATHYTDALGVGDPTVTVYYRVQASFMPPGGPSCPSDAVGELDYSTAGAVPPRLHIVTGTVLYSNGTIPTIDGEATFWAYITTRPEEALTQADAGCASFFDGSDYWVIIQCGTFPTPWSVGEVLHIDLALDGASNGGVPELRQLDIVLDDEPVQDWGIWWP
jgi:hypothetical protein